MTHSNKFFVADFETTIGEYKDTTNVWLWAIFDGTTVVHGSDIDSFFYNVFNNRKYHNKKIYFHNLKFDGMFLLHFILSNNINYESSISHTGVWYSLRLTDIGVTFHDSLKRISCPVRDIPKYFDLVETKGDIYYGDYSYSIYNLLYIDLDVIVVFLAIQIQISQGLTKDTRASNALHLFKQSINNFSALFPTIPVEVDSEIRQAYFGGLTLAHKTGEFYNGSVYDVNSMYPWAMSEMRIPVGNPILSQEQLDDKLNIYKIYIDADIKPGGICCIPAKVKSRDMKYISTTNGTLLIYVTDVDLKHIFINYDIHYFDVIEVFAFNYSVGVFKKYIDTHMDGKINATTSYEKLYHKEAMNALYGKFGASPKFIRKNPFINEKNTISFIQSEPEDTKTVYLPVAIYTTSYARDKLLNTIYDLGDRFIYCDTDSVHIEGVEPPTIEIHDTKLGAWKLENYFTRGKFLRPKTYLEEINGKLKPTVAGLPHYCHSQITFENFNIGARYTGKLAPRQRKGGVILTETTYEIK